MKIKFLAIFVISSILSVVSCKYCYNKGKINGKLEGCKAVVYHILEVANMTPSEPGVTYYCKKVLNK